MVISLNKGTPIYTPKYHNSYYGDPQEGTCNFGKPPYRGLGFRDVKETYGCQVFSRELMSRTSYVRLLVHADLCGAFKGAGPTSCEKLAKSQVVVEMSCCPVEWAEHMMASL